MPNPLASPADYEAFVYALPDRYPSIERSSLVYIPLGTRVGKVVGSGHRQHGQGSLGQFRECHVNRQRRHGAGDHKGSQQSRTCPVFGMQASGAAQAGLLALAARVSTLVLAGAMALRQMGLAKNATLPSRVGEKILDGEPVAFNGARRVRRGEWRKHA